MKKRKMLIAGLVMVAGLASAKDRPVKVYILSGQSNMVGMGDISGGAERWGKEFLDAEVSVYEGEYDPKAEYDKLTPIKTMKLESFGGVTPTPYPGGGTQVVRGQLQPQQTGVYQFHPGYDKSVYNIMEVNGVEVYRREVGQEPVWKPIKLTAGEKVPFKITYLTRDANGLGWWIKTDVPGTLHTLVKAEGRFPHLVDAAGNWKARDDVIYKGVISATGQGPLRVGVQQGGTIGPELGFGWVIGDFHEEPVLLIKASIGNRSLGWDILPPGSQRYTFEGKVYAGYKDPQPCWPLGSEPQPGNWYAGKQYDEYTQAVRDVLEKFDTLFPDFKGRGYEIAGFVWWQGHKDSGDPAHIANYEKNLAALIETWRKEFHAPKAPWVIATLGFGGDKKPDKFLRILEAQMAVADPKKHPEFAGNVATVDTRPFWREASVSPKSQDYHYNRNAETYYLVGEALGKSMVKLQGGL